MKRKIFSTMLVLVLMLSLGLANAPPASAEVGTHQVIPFTLSDKDDAEAEAIWGDQAGDIAVHLTTGPSEGDGDTATIAIDASDVGIATLADVASIDWTETLVLGDGYPAHVDIMIDGDALVVEYAYNDGGYLPVTDASYAWLTSGAPGPVGGAFGDDGHYGTTLADWKAGQTVPGDVVISGATEVLSLEIEIDNWIVASESYIDGIMVNGDTYYGSIQDAVDDAAPDDTVVVAAGTYSEQVVIDKSLTLQGAGDTTVIKPSGPELTVTTSIPWIGGGTGTMSAIVSVETTGGEVIMEGFEIDGSLITTKSTAWLAGLVYLETGGRVAGVTVNGGSTLPDRTAGIFAAAITETVSLEVTECTVEVYTRAGIYALGGTITADYHHNEINGPGDTEVGVPNGMFFLEGANGSATYNTITDLGYVSEEEYRSTGIGTYNAGSSVVFAHNDISNVQNAFALSNNTDGTVVEDNEVYGCHTGVRIEAGATNSVIQYNNIHDNDFAIRCSNEMGSGNIVHFNSFVDNFGVLWTNMGESIPNTYVGAVCNLHPTFVLEAAHNWWGQSSGPSSVNIDAVDYEPWLLTSDLEGPTYDKTLVLNPGWSIVSPDAELAGHAIVDSVGLVYEYDTGAFSEVTDMDSITPVFVKTADGGGIGFNYADNSMGMFTTNLEAGWNLIGVPLTDADTRAVLSSLRYGQNDETALATLVSQGQYNHSGESFYVATTHSIDWLNLPNLNEFDGYWAYMNVPKEFGVVVVEGGE